MPTPNRPPSAAPAQRPLKDLLAEFDVTDETLDEQLGAAAPSVTAATPAGGGSPPATPPAPPARKDPSLLDEARHLGMSDEDIDQLSPADLDRTVSLMRRANNRRVSATHSHLDRPPAGQPDLPAAGAAATRSPSPGAEPAAAEVDLGIEDVGLYEEAFVEALRKNFAALQAEVAQLKADLAGVRQWASTRQQRDDDDRLNSAFRKLADAVPAMFSAKGREELDPQGDEYARRRSVVQEMVRVDAAARKAGAPVSFEAAFNRAVKTLYGATVIPAAASSPGGASSTPPGTETARPGARPKRADGTFMSDAEIEAEARKEEWVEGALDRPTDRDNHPEPKGERRATRVVRQHLAAANGPPGHREEDELPD